MGENVDEDDYDQINSDFVGLDMDLYDSISDKNLSKVSKSRESEWSFDDSEAIKTVRGQILISIG